MNNLPNQKDTTTNKKSLFIIFSIFIVIFLIFWYFYSKDKWMFSEPWLWKEVIDLDKKPEKITKKEYLETKWITDFKNDNQDKKEQYVSEISSLPNTREVFIYLWISINGELMYQEIHDDFKYNKYKNSTLTQDEIEQISNKLTLSPILLKKVELSNYKYLDPILVSSIYNYKTKEKKIVSIEKATSYKYNFLQIDTKELESLVTDSTYISLVWIFEKKVKKQELLDIIKKVATKDRCNLRDENKTKRYMYPDASLLEFFTQTDCNKIVIGYFQLESWKVIDRVFVDSFYTLEEKQIYLDNYATLDIETTGDDVILTKVYYDLNQKYPLIFF